MEGTWFVPDQEPDDNEKKAEKKDKKDAEAVMKKASLLELFTSHQAEREKERAEKESNETGEEADPNENSEEVADPELETLSTEEELATSEALVDERLEAVEAELEDPSLSPEAQAAAIAAASYLEQIAERLDSGEPLSEELVAETADTISQALETSLPEAVPEPEDEDDVPGVPTPPTTPNPPIPPTGGSAGGPPLPPVFPSPNVGFPGFPNGTPVASQPNFNTAPQPARTTPEATERHSHAKYVLAGGIVGYLLGRRRGRIKTEKQLLPVQRKLETTVDELRQQLISKEQKVRHLAAEQREQSTLMSAAEARQHVEAQRQKRAEHLRQYAEKEPKAPEQIGKFTLRLQEREPLPRVQDMNDRRLFELAQKIPLAGTTVAELYRQGRLDVAKVREIAEAFLSGKSYEQLAIKSLHTDDYQGAGSTPRPLAPSQDPMSRLADLLPAHLAQRMNNEHWPDHKKEPHIMARVGIVAAFGTVVVVVAVIVTLWMFNAL